MKDQCGYVVNKDDKNMETVDQESDLTNVQPKKVVWKKQRFPGYKDCKEALEMGFKGEETIPISLQNGDTTTASCDMKTNGGGWTVFQRRMKPLPDFQQGWAAYKQGFGRRNASHWLGLEALSSLTSSGNVTLRIDLKNSSNVLGYAEYTDFKVSNEANNYQLSLGHYTGDIGDAMRVNDGMNYTTFDRDNDNDDSYNSANFYAGPWWHGQTYNVNLNNKYSNSIFNPPVYYMSWKTWNNQYGKITFSEMKLRRV